MTQVELKKNLGKVDIYLLDQVMKNRYLETDTILDAGCGKGRNLIFLHNLGFKIEGCDVDERTINKLKHNYSNINLSVCELNNLPYIDNSFNHIICNAVLHFAENEIHFLKMIDELYRVLKPKGSLFIRMTSIFGLENLVIKKEEQYLLPDGTNRFLLSLNHISKLKEKFTFIAPLKTVNVNNLRCMSTLVLQKNHLSL